MRNKILKTAVISLFALGMSVACSKKGAASAAVATGDISQCPQMSDLKPGQTQYYQMQSDSVTKMIAVTKKQDRGQRYPFFQIQVSPNETIQIDGRKDNQDVGQKKQDGGYTGGIKANCEGGRFILAGHDSEGRDVGLSIATKADANNDQGLQVSETSANGQSYYYSRTNAFKGWADLIVSGGKKLGNSDLSGFPHPEDLKPK